MSLIAAADVGGTTIKLALVREGCVVARTAIPSEPERGFAAALVRMTSAWAVLGNQADEGEPVAAYGIGFPGVISAIDSRVFITPAGKFDDAKTLDLQEWARATLNRPLVVYNDAKAALVGESKWGAAKGYANVAMITLGTGVGTAVMINGALLEGAHGLAGNAGGHVTINFSGSRCACGNIGCVELEGSTSTLRHQAKLHPQIASSALQEIDELNYQVILALAEKDDPVAIYLRDRSLKAWAIAAVNLVNSFDPEVVIIGGGVSAAGSAIISYIADYVATHAWAQWPVRVVAAELGNDAGLLGIASLANRAER